MNINCIQYLKKLVAMEFTNRNPSQSHKAQYICEEESRWKSYYIQGTPLAFCTIKIDTTPVLQ